MKYPVDTVIQFTLLSFDGKQVPVTVTGNYVTEGRMWVDADSSTLCFDDFTGLGSARVLQDRFLELSYYTRCGTGCSMRPYVLICVVGGKLQTALPVESVYWYYETAWECKKAGIDADEDHHLWEWDYKLLQQGDRYILQRGEHHLVESECTPAINVNSYDTTVLDFSTEFGVFYTNIDTVSGQFGQFRQSGTSLGARQEDVVCPVLEWGDRKLWFFEGAWCFKDDDGDFLCGEGRDCYYER